MTFFRNPWGEESTIIVSYVIVTIYIYRHIFIYNTKNPSMECPICMEKVTVDKQITLSCNHSFCEHCLLSWINTNLSETCPCCRQSIHLYNGVLTRQRNKKLQNVIRFQLKNIMLLSLLNKEIHIEGLTYFVNPSVQQNTEKFVVETIHYALSCFQKEPVVFVESEFANLVQQCIQRKPYLLQNHRVQEFSNLFEILSKHI